MLTLVESKYRIQWETFTKKDEFAVDFPINVGVVGVSADMIDVMIGYKKWSGVRQIDAATGDYTIGYGQGDYLLQKGMTESESFAEWYGYVQNRQKILRNQIPIINIPQTIFDALVSLYLDTGRWRTVVAREGTYDLSSAIENSNWLLCADIISRGTFNPMLRRVESRVAMLADYTVNRSRQQNTIAGIHELRNSYSGLSNEFDKLQTEFVYYRQIGAFLSGMSDLRKRRVISQL
jgi:hypothetical protein